MAHIRLLVHGREKMFYRLLGSTIGTLGVIFHISPVASGQPVFIPMGDLPGGGTTSIALGVSANGAVVVGQGHGKKTPGDWAIRWDGGAVSPVSNAPQSENQSVAWAVSDNGALVVGQYANGVGFWKNGVFQDTGLLPGGCTSRGTDDVAGSPPVIVGWSCSSSGNQATRWENGTLQGIGDLPGGTFESYAYSISHDATTIVGWSRSANGPEAFKWKDGIMTPLGDIPGGDFISEAHAVSSDGSVVVGVGTTVITPSIANRREAFRWENGTLTPLGFLAGVSGIRSEAEAVSGDGSIVAGWSGNLDTRQAFIWDAQHGMRNLKTVLTQEFGLDLTGWTLRAVNDISLDGLTLVGNGRNPLGESEGWIVRLPEPGCIGVIGVLYCFSIGRRRAVRN